MINGLPTLIPIADTVEPLPPIPHPLEIPQNAVRGPRSHEQNLENSERRNITTVHAANLHSSMWSTSNKLPDGLLATNYRNRDVLPAGMSPRRTFTTVGLYESTMGTEHGVMNSRIPYNEKLRKTYHFDAEYAEILEQERHALTPQHHPDKPTGYLQYTHRGNLQYSNPTMLEPIFSPREKAIMVEEEKGRPTWARIRHDFKFDWSITRDRTLSGKGGQSIGSVNAIVHNTQRKGDSQTWTNDATIEEIPGLKSSLGALDDEFKSKIDTPKLGVLQAHSKILTKYEQRVAAIAARQKLTNERLSTAKS